MSGKYPLSFAALNGLNASIIRTTLWSIVATIERTAVRFWGHDSAIEASFFIDEDALKRIQPDAHPDASGFLNAFDCNRDLICAAAAKIYVRGSRGSYDLVAAHF
jgi:hypothetical protein